jgi:hypothetical protein
MCKFEPGKNDRQVRTWEKRQASSNLGKTTGKSKSTFLLERIEIGVFSQANPESRFSTGKFKSAILHRQIASSAATSPG